MIIERVGVQVFTYMTRRCRDAAGHAHPGPEAEAKQALLTIETDDGSRGHAFAPLEVVRPHVVEAFFRKVLIGENPFDREKLWLGLDHWQRGGAGQLTDRALCAVDLALWDLAGRALGVPVFRLIGGYRDKVPAYGSIMCGDDLEGGLATPEDYARFSEKLAARGYKGIKLHTWMPPISFAPDAKKDVAACAAVREAVGPDIELMLDGYHWYSRSDAYYIGRELERLNFSWIEEPMNEHSASAYAWLSRNLSIPVLGPESISGKHRSRADWIKADASDIMRTGVIDVGGITPSLKVAHLADAFGMDCEIHGEGAANLAICASIQNCRWYERGLLHPFLDYDKPFPYLKSIPDPMDENGIVTLPGSPGLGEDIDFEFIENNTIQNY